MPAKFVCTEGGIMFICSRGSLPDSDISRNGSPEKKVAAGFAHTKTSRTGRVEIEIYGSSNSLGLDHRAAKDWFSQHQSSGTKPQKKVFTRGDWTCTVFFLQFNHGPRDFGMKNAGASSLPEEVSLDEFKHSLIFQG